jgi:DHA1 family inner membrane transport protein
LFVATPFLLQPVAERFGVSEGLVGGISVAQVGAFAVANFVLPRLVRPSGRILRYAALTLVVMNLASVIPTDYWMLLTLRLVAGFAAGTMTWLAWSNAMKRPTTMSSVAATGPVTALVASPILAYLSDFGDRAVYVALAVAAVPAVVLIAPIVGRRRARGHVSRSKSNRLLLVALFALTFFGSSLYINLTIVARDIHDLAPLAASIGFSLNALGGLIGARLSSRHSHPGLFLMSIAVAVGATIVGGSVLFFVGMFWWGFAFWMGVPGVLQMLVDRSLQPSERAGDGQGVMALGRALGPAMGGAFVDAGALQALAAVSALGLASTGATVVGVKAGRDRLPPSDTETIDQGH